MVSVAEGEENGKGAYEMSFVTLSAKPIGRRKVSARRRRDIDFATPRPDVDAEAGEAAVDGRDVCIGVYVGYFASAGVSEGRPTEGEDGTARASIFLCPLFELVVCAVGGCS